MTLEHGGRLNAAVKRWGIARQHWLDLSTGINPISWPVPEIPAHLWQRLPEADDGLNEIIRHSYAAPAHADCEPVAGSQAAIMALPRLRQPCSCLPLATGWTHNCLDQRRTHPCRR